MIDFRVCGQIAASEITHPAGHPRRLALRVLAPSELKRVDEIRNGGDIFHINTEGDVNSASLLVEDMIVEHRVVYYYVRVTLMNGCQAWCSPIWVET